jgi:hypothetical protein
MAARVVALWGEDLSGICHLEAFMTPCGPVPIELNPRIGGAETFTNLCAVWGVDLGYQVTTRVVCVCVCLCVQGVGWGREGGGACSQVGALRLSALRIWPECSTVCSCVHV